MNAICQIITHWFLAAIVMCAVGQAEGQMDFIERPATLQEFIQTLRKTAESAMTLPPPKVELSEEFLTAFVKDPYLQRFVRPRGEIVLIANQIRYLWTYRRELTKKMAELRKSRKYRSEQELRTLDLQDLLGSGTRPARKPTPAEAEFLQTYLQRIQDCQKSITESLAALEEMAPKPENQSFALQKSSMARKAIAKLEKSYETL